MKTEQEKFWMNRFGNSYSKRNKKRNTKNFYKKILLKTGKIKSAFEIGTNIGLNLDEFKKIDHKIKTFGVEINRFAYERCYEKGHQVFNDSIFDFKINKKYDLVFTSGVLIHINPKKLNKVYSKLFSLSKKFILVEEYFNPTPVSVTYRKNKNKLFKRDFAKEIMKKYNLKLIDYGFLWSEDKKVEADNTNWFLFKKKLKIN